LGVILFGMLAACQTTAPPLAPVEPGPSLEMREGAGEVAPELVPEMLKDRVAITGYRQTSDRERTSIAMTLENLTTGETLTFELCALFVDAADTKLFTTEWQRVVIAGGRKHEFYAETTDKGAAKGSVLLRQVLPVSSTPTPAAGPTP
jgi:hypothetical protein